jgi:hypothetical protein
MASGLLKRISSVLRSWKHRLSRRSGKPSASESIVKFRNAVVCELCGGLANQIICYKFGRYIAEKQKRVLILDASWYSDQPVGSNRNLQLTNFGVQYDAIIFSKDLIEAVLRQHTVTSLSGPQFHRFEDVDTVRLADQRLAESKPLVHCDLWGGLTLRGIADDFAGEHFLHEFQLNPDSAQLSDAHHISQKLISVSRDPVAVHVRRGDFAAHDGNLLLTAEYFNCAIKKLESELEDPVFFVFSDEIEWCKLHLKSAVCIYFMDFNDERHAFGDLALAISCKHFVLSHRSTFSHQMVELNRMQAGRRVILSTDGDFERNQPSK